MVRRAKFVVGRPSATPYDVATTRPCNPRLKRINSIAILLFPWMFLPNLPRASTSLWFLQYRLSRFFFGDFRKAALHLLDIDESDSFMFAKDFEEGMISFLVIVLDLAFLNLYDVSTKFLKCFLRRLSYQFDIFLGFPDRYYSIFRSSGVGVYFSYFGNT